MDIKKIINDPLKIPFFPSGPGEGKERSGIDARIVIQ
jgi:hypothetical protein